MRYPLFMLRCVALLVSLVFFVTLPAAAQSVSPLQQGLTEELRAKLQAGGLNIFFRHGKTLREGAPKGGDYDVPEPGNCSLQRNLSQEGIDQMRAVGEAFDALGINVSVVRASPLCRCVDTAWHAFGRVERDRNLALNGDTPDGDASQKRPWDHIRNLGRVPPPPMTNSVFISHSRVGEIFGGSVIDEGEAVIVEPDGKGGFKLLARVNWNEWK
jgi:hypothetical protein